MTELTSDQVPSEGPAQDLQRASETGSVVAAREAGRNRAAVAAGFVGAAASQQRSLCPCGRWALDLATQRGKAIECGTGN